MNKDDYAIREVERNRAYRDAYESPEAKKWLAECDVGAEVIKKTFFTKGQIEKAINSL